MKLSVKKQIFCSKSCSSKDAWRKEKERRAEKKKPSHNLEKINEEARRMGLSYGKYKAMIYRQQMETGNGSCTPIKLNWVYEEHIGPEVDKEKIMGFIDGRKK